MTDRTSEELMELYQQLGDVAAFEEIYRRHRGGVESLIVNMLNRYAPQLLANTADLVQDVFSFIHAYRQRFIGSARFTPWLYTTAKRLTQNHVRYETNLCRDYRRTGHYQEVDLEPSIPESAMKMDTSKTLVEHGLHRLPETHKQVIHLVYFEGLSSVEVAERLGVPVTTVNWWRKESLAIMRFALEEPETSAA